MLKRGLTILLICIATGTVTAVLTAMLYMGTSSHSTQQPAKEAHASPLAHKPVATLNKSTPKKKPLDLSIPVEHLNTSSLAYYSDSSTLPNLFNLKKNKEEIIIGGRILTDPLENDSLDGAEVSLEISIY